MAEVILQVVVVGASGMLGHKVLRALQSEHHVTGFIRRDRESLPSALQGISRSANLEPAELATSIALLEPDFIINCAGAVKQRNAGKDAGPAYQANVVLPLELDRMAAECGAQLIHISTDCVFDGEKPGKRPFTLEDAPDAHDVYGVSKRAGELVAPGAMILRTSIVGPEVFDRTGLLEWAFSRRWQRVNGYARAVFSGIPTITLAELIAEIIRAGKWQSGIFQVATAPTSKADWLELVNDTFQLDLEIDRTDDYFCDRSLDASTFEALLGRKLPLWSELVKEMHADYMSDFDIYQGR